MTHRITTVLLSPKEDIIHAAHVQWEPVSERGSRDQCVCQQLSMK
jgi:hypothetical protein